MMPVISHSTQERKTWQIVVFIIDDANWMDVGFNGGEIMVSNPMP